MSELESNIEALIFCSPKPIKIDDIQKTFFEYDKKKIRISQKNMLICNTTYTETKNTTYTETKNTTYIETKNTKKSITIHVFHQYLYVLLVFVCFACFVRAGIFYM